MAPIFRHGIRTKIVLMMAGTALAGMSVAVAVCYHLASDSMSELVRTRLVSLGEARAAQLDALAESLCTNAVGLSRGLSAGEALTDFSRAYARMEATPLTHEEEGRLREFYSTIQGWGPTPGESRPGPEDPVARRLQLAYCLNVDSVARVARVSSGADTPYDVVHAKYHPVFREILRAFDNYYDIFLVEEASGRVVYTTLKETDFGVSLNSPAFAGTPLAAAYRAVTSGGRPVALTDYASYGPSAGAPAAFVAAPIVIGGERRGVLVFQVRQDPVHRVVTGGGEWTRDGLGRTGDCVCVGEDGYLRSDSRHFGINRKDYLAALRSRGADAAQLERCENRRTTVLNLRIPAAGAPAVVADAVESPDYRGVASLAVVKPVRFGEANWQLRLTMDADEAFEDVRDLWRALVWGVCFTVAVLLLASLYLSRQLVAPIRTLTDAADAIAHGDESVVVHLKSGDEFEAMGENFNRMVRNLREKTRRIEEKERTKSRFLAGMSHEIRTPMNAILGYAQMLAKDAGLTPHQRMEIEVINRSGDHLMAIIDDILEMAKMEAGTVALEAAAFDFGLMLESVVGFHRMRAREKGLSLSYTCGHDLPRCVVSDEAKLRRILSNVLGNAVKFTKSGGIDFSAHLLAADDRVRYIRFVVKDSGPGVKSDDVPSIFDPFSQGHAGIAQGGTGLGLAISRRYARMLGGDIALESPPEGGAVFIITVRLMVGATGSLTPEVSSRRPLRLSPNQGAVRVLIADADEASRATLVAVLKPFGFVLREAVDGPAACRLFAEWRPHAVLMDLRVPGMDGFEATAAMRAEPHGANAAILAMSVAEHDEATVQAAGIDEIIRKPIDAAAVVHRLGARLGLEYEYESAPEQAKDSQGEPMPDELAEAMIRSAREADYETLLSLIDRVAVYDKGFADKLRAMAVRFDYDGVLILLAPPADAGGV